MGQREGVLDDSRGPQFNTSMVVQLSKEYAKADTISVEVMNSLARQASFQVQDFTPKQLVQLISNLATMMHQHGQSRGDADDAEDADENRVRVPSRLLDEGATRIAGAVAVNGLATAEIVQATFAYTLAGSYSRQLFDTSYRCLLGLPALEDPTLTCMSCMEESQAAAADGDAAAAAADDDDVCIVEDVSLSDLNHTDLYRLAWAFAVARTQDERHRAVRDVPLLNALAEQVRQQVQEVPTSLIVALLAVFSSIPHYEPRLYNEAAVVLWRRLVREEEEEKEGSSNERVAQHTGLTLGQGLSVIRSYSRVQHTHSTQLLLAIMQWIVEGGRLEQLGSVELLDLATAMTKTSAISLPLMKAVLGKADRTGALSNLVGRAEALRGSGIRSRVRFSPPQLLELARVIAAVQHTDPPFFEVALRAILQSVNMSNLEEDLAYLSDHCGSTQDGLKK